MKSERLTMFTDGVVAILITILVLELKVPHEATVGALVKLWPVFLGHVLSFVYLGIYWNNHHHMFHLTPKISGGVMWANLHLLFWLSLLPFVTGWTGEEVHAVLPMLLYGFVLLMSAVAYFILQEVIMGVQGKDSALRKAVGKDVKGKISPLLYLLGMGLALVSPWLGMAMYALVAALWLVPDKRIEKIL